MFPLKDKRKLLQVFEAAEYVSPLPVFHRFAYSHSLFRHSIQLVINLPVSQASTSVLDPDYVARR
jgi:hypothetical protein